jgi:hypothetical protein
MKKEEDMLKKEREIETIFFFKKKKKMMDLLTKSRYCSQNRGKKMQNAFSFPNLMEEGFKDLVSHFS